MSEVVIVAEGLGKKYLIGHRGPKEQYQTLRDVVVRKSGDLLRRAGDALRGRQLVTGGTVEEFWALKDVTFSVQSGEVMGIIGRNGAGKSTLLKVLSRITEPSIGRVTIKGRVASLLEVGTGFHPELTGRENIYLNGAILGMSRVDIRSRFDEIVAFSEVEKFLDTPVKRYSSGMYVRLAFAIAAHLEPDVLIVDEVLAVGDARFQKKCLGKIREASSREGRTVLFVSHQMSMVTSLCTKALLLEHGQIVFEGTAAAAASQYYTQDGTKPYFADYSKSGQRVGDATATLLWASIEDDQGREAGEIDIRSSFHVKMRYRLSARATTPSIPALHIYNSQGQLVFATLGKGHPKLEGGLFESVCIVPGNLMNSDVYFFDLILMSQGGLHIGFHERGALSVVIVDPVEETQNEDVRHGYAGRWDGAVRPRLDWKIQRLSEKTLDGYPGQL